MADQLVFDGHDFADLAVQLKEAAARYEHEMTPTMLLIGEEVKEAAKKIADQKSSKVAATIKADPLPGAVAVRAGDQQTPIAQLWELGNRGSKRSARQFRHRVYGRDVWVWQDKYPYLSMAMLVTRKQITKRLEQAWERVLRRIEEGR